MRSPYLFVFPQCIVGWSGVKNFAACWGKRLRLVNVAVFEGCNILFQLFYNVFHRLWIAKMESWRSSKVLCSTWCSNWQQYLLSKFNWKSDFCTEARFANSSKPRRTRKGNFKCKVQQIEHWWCSNTSPQ